MNKYVRLDMAFGLGTGATLFDKSRHRAHGAINGAEWAMGLHGYALDFEANDKDYVEIPAVYTHLNFTAEDFSIIARFKPETLPTYTPAILSRGSMGLDGYFFAQLIGVELIFITNQSGIYQASVTLTGVLTEGQWYTLGLTRQGANAYIYRNGIDITSSTTTHIDPATSSRSAKIGIWDDKITGPTDGLFEFLRVFGKALTASEHLAWHNALA